VGIDKPSSAAIQPRSSLTGPEAIEIRSIDWVPPTERHGQVWQQGPFWFLSNFQPFSLSNRRVVRLSTPIDLHAEAPTIAAGQAELARVS